MFWRMHFSFFCQKVKGFMLKTCFSTFFNRNWKVGKERKSKMIRSSASKSLKKQPKGPKERMRESSVGLITQAESAGRLPLTSGADPSQSTEMLGELHRPRLASPCLAWPRLASPRVALPRFASPCLALPGLQMRFRSSKSCQKVRFLTYKTSKMASENACICSVFLHRFSYISFVYSCIISIVVSLR